MRLANERACVVHGRRGPWQHWNKYRLCPEDRGNRSSVTAESPRNPLEHPPPAGFKGQTAPAPEPLLPTAPVLGVGTPHRKGHQGKSKVGKWVWGELLCVPSPSSGLCPASHMSWARGVLSTRLGFGVLTLEWVGCFMMWKLRLLDNV